MSYDSCMTPPPASHAGRTTVSVRLTPSELAELDEVLELLRRRGAPFRYVLKTRSDALRFVIRVALYRERKRASEVEHPSDPGLVEGA
jgi:hypothetical protein